MIYPTLLERTKAMIIDAVILVAALILTSDVLGAFENVPDTLKIILMAGYFVLCEPLMLSLFGGTIGHQFIGLTVRQNGNHQKKVGFLMAIARYATKTLLGWFSLLTLFSSAKKRALHDMAGGSVVLYKEKTAF